MLNTILNALATAFVAILLAVISFVGAKTVSFIEQKKAALQVKIGADTYNKNLAFAKSAWNIVDEYFRITPTAEKTLDSTAKMFTDEMKKFVPQITDADIEQLRQAIAGEVNQGKFVIVTGFTAPAVAPTAQATVLAETITTPAQ
jgi:hypothetical protein